VAALIWRVKKINMKSTKAQLIKAVILVLLCFCLAWLLGSALEEAVRPPQSTDCGYPAHTYEDVNERRSKRNSN